MVRSFPWFALARHFVTAMRKVTNTSWLRTIVLLIEGTLEVTAVKFKGRIITPSLSPIIIDPYDFLGYIHLGIWTESPMHKPYCFYVRIFLK